MTKKLKAVLEASEEDISLDDVLDMNEPEDVNDTDGSIFESEDEDEDDKLDEDELNAKGHIDTNEGKSKGDETIKESKARAKRIAERKKLKEAEDDDDDMMKEEEDFDAEGVEDPDDIIKEARRIMSRSTKKLSEKKKLKEDEDEDEDDMIEEDVGYASSNEGKSKGDETTDKTGDFEDGNIFEDIENIIGNGDESDADIFGESEDEDEDDKEKLAESDDEDEDDEELKESKAKKLKESKARAKKLAERKKLKEAEDEDDDKSAKDEIEIDEEDDDEEDSKTLSEKEQKIVMEALKLPASAKKEIKTIFESMVNSKVKSLKKSLNEKAKVTISKQRDELIEALELYSSETIRKWKSENAPVFNQMKRMKKLEESFKAMAGVFAELGFQTVLSESEVKNKYSELVKDHKKLLERNTRLEEFVERAKVKELYESAIGGLSNNQKRKFVALAESLEYDNVKDLNEKLNTLKKLFVEKKKYESDDVDSDANDNLDEEDDDNDDGVILAKESKRAASTDLISESLKILSR